MTAKYRMPRWEREMFERLLDDLRNITDGCRSDMHEPDEQSLSAKIEGRKLDNAGIDGELCITLKRIKWGEHDTKARTLTQTFNICDLIALARMAKMPPAFED